MLFFQAFFLLFLATDAIGLLPIFMGITRRLSDSEKKLAIHHAVFASLCLALPFLAFGEAVIAFLHITMDDFRVAGGITLMVIALSDLLGSLQSRTMNSSSIVAFVVPLITGPAVIATLLVEVQRYGRLITFGALLGNYFIAWLLLHYSRRISRWLGVNGATVISKVSSLFLVAISVGMIRSGVSDMISSWVR